MANMKRLILQAVDRLALRWLRYSGRPVVMNMTFTGDAGTGIDIGDGTVDVYLRGNSFKARAS